MFAIFGIVSELYWRRGCSANNHVHERIEGDEDNYVNI